MKRIDVRKIMISFLALEKASAEIAKDCFNMKSKTFTGVRKPNVYKPPVTYIKEFPKRG